MAMISILVMGGIMLAGMLGLLMLLLGVILWIVYRVRRANHPGKILRIAALVLTMIGSLQGIVLPLVLYCIAFILW